MKKFIIIAPLIVLSGCCFDGQLQHDSFVPADLVVKNKTGHKVNIRLLYNFDTEVAGFSIPGQSLRPNEEMDTINITRRGYEAISDQYFFISGSCGEFDNDEAPGSRFRVEASAKKEHVLITIDSCESFK
ncbi:hypothetical protein ONV78_26700 [Hahella sp. CR1]|uniref:hypothetical protein n=1 Tax=Hahella sp. CR1 TaxID=2992807 RepID=UPI0024420218|nr:hypothetical protein [Hahella sp. CR1]MDG9671352.1 hypothetical protein [Hahella sp. CR1]